MNKLEKAIKVEKAKRAAIEKLREAEIECFVYFQELEDGPERAHAALVCETVRVAHESMTPNAELRDRPLADGPA